MTDQEKRDLGRVLLDNYTLEELRKDQWWVGRSLEFRQLSNLFLDLAARGESIDLLTVGDVLRRYKEETRKRILDELLMGVEMT